MTRKANTHDPKKSDERFHEAYGLFLHDGNLIDQANSAEEYLTYLLLRAYHAGQAEAELQYVTPRSVRLDDIEELEVVIESMQQGATGSYGIQTIDDFRERNPFRGRNPAATGLTKLRAFARLIRGGR